MATRHDVVEYIRDRIVDAGFEIKAIYEKEKICLQISNNKYETPKICSKSELYAYAKAFFYVFIQKKLKKTSESS